MAGVIDDVIDLSNLIFPKLVCLTHVTTELFKNHTSKKKTQRFGNRPGSLQQEWGWHLEHPEVEGGTNLQTS